MRTICVETSSKLIVREPKECARAFFGLTLAEKSDTMIAVTQNRACHASPAGIIPVGGDRMKRKKQSAGNAVPTPAETASATECTGLMAALPRDEGEEESLSRLGGVFPAEDV